MASCLFVSVGVPSIYPSIHPSTNGPSTKNNNREEDDDDEEEGEGMEEEEGEQVGALPASEFMRGGMGEGGEEEDDDDDSDAEDYHIRVCIFLKRGGGECFFGGERGG